MRVKLMKTLKEFDSSRKNTRLRRSEMQARDEWAKFYDGDFDEYWFLTEIAPVIKAINPVKSDLILDLGSGTGRATVELVREGSRVVAIDYSAESLRVCRKRCLGRANTVCADIGFLPLRQFSLNKVASCQVIEHIPGEANRIGVFNEVSRVTRSGGLFVITVYNYGIKQKITKSKKDGYHGGRIYFHRFEFSELEKMFSQSRDLKLIRATGIINVPSFMRRLIRSVNVEMSMEKVLSHLPFWTWYSHLLLAVSIKQEQMHPDFQR
jgi:SAM-dependent methyltransferase